MVLVGDDAHVDAHLGLFADRANLDARNLHGFVECTKGSEIILDAPDGTPR
jgi:hypothetical protein